MTDYGSTDEAEARVFVGDVRLPITDQGLTTELRKQGPMAINRHSEAFFPASGFGADWTEKIGIQQNGDSAVSKIVDVQFREESEGEYVTVHRGYLKGVGGSGQPNKAKISIGSVTDFLSVVPASVSFNGTVNIDDVLKYIVDTLESAQPVFDDIEIATPQNLHLDSAVYATYGESLDDILYIVGGGLVSNVLKGKRFTPNRDTLADVLNWLQNHTDKYYFFEPKKDGGLALTVTEGIPSKTLRQSSLGGTVDVLGNNALWNIRPFNRLIATGEASSARSLSDSALDVATVQGQEYPKAVVQHETLVERAGGPIPMQIDVDAQTLKAVENVAKKKLKRRLDQAGGGLIRTKLEPTVMPYAQLIAQPTVNDDAFDSVKPLEYELESVKHRAVADVESTSDGVGSRTDCRVSMWVSEEDIVVVDDETGIIEV